jgi:hypothetical protein
MMKKLIIGGYEACTVQELIDHLKTLPPDCPVVYQCCSDHQPLQLEEIVHGKEKYAVPERRSDEPGLRHRGRQRKTDRSHRLPRELTMITVETVCPKCGPVVVIPTHVVITPGAGIGRCDGLCPSRGPCPKCGQELRCDPEECFLAGFIPEGMEVTEMPISKVQFTISDAQEEP